MLAQIIHCFKKTAIFMHFHTQHVQVSRFGSKTQHCTCLQCIHLYVYIHIKCTCFPQQIMIFFFLNHWEYWRSEADVYVKASIPDRDLHVWMSVVRCWAGSYWWLYLEWIFRGWAAFCPLSSGWTGGKDQHLEMSNVQPVICLHWTIPLNPIKNMVAELFIFKSSQIRLGHQCHSLASF